MDTEINMSVFAPHSFEVVDVRPIGTTSIILTRPRQKGATGFRNTINLGHGIYATWASVQRAEPVEETYDANGNIKINLRIAGNSVISGRTHGPFAVTDMMCSALLQPQGRKKIERFEADETETSVTISCTREYLIEELGLSPDFFDGPLQAFLQGKPFEFTLLKTDFTIELKQAADAFFAPAPDAFSQRLLLHARATDIVRLFFQQTRDQKRNPIRHRARDVDLVAHIKQLICDNLEDPPVTAEIATIVGSSASRMMRVFKLVEGRTISEFIASQRMARALELMHLGRMSITEIAFEVGYEHSANFSTAFRRHYGMTPRQAMQSAAASAPPQ